MVREDFDEKWVEYCKQRKKELQWQIEDLKREIRELEDEIKFYERQINKDRDKHESK